MRWDLHRCYWGIKLPHTITRTPIATGDPVDELALTEHMRLDGDLVAGAYPYIWAAAAEIEAYCDLALLDQSITLTANAHEQDNGLTIQRLPIGPNPTSIMVEGIETDGTLLPIPYSWVFYGGAVRFASRPDRPVRITYKADYGSIPDTIPADLRMAICDLAARLYDYRASDKAPTSPQLQHA